MMLYSKADIDILNKYQYPNLVLEIEMGTAGHICTYANYAHVTERLLQEFVAGKAELAVNEVANIINAYRFTDISIGLSYLLYARVSYYDYDNPKHLKKIKILFWRFEQAIEDYYNFFFKMTTHECKILQEAKELADEVQYMSRAKYNWLSNQYRRLQWHIDSNRNSILNPPRDIGIQ